MGRRLIQPLFFDLIDQPASRGFLDVDGAPRWLLSRLLMAAQLLQHLPVRARQVKPLPSPIHQFAQQPRRIGKEQVGALVGILNHHECIFAVNSMIGRKRQTPSHAATRRRICA